MKLATLKNGTRDGELIVVSKDLTKAVRVPQIAPTLQIALEHWSVTESDLKDVYDETDISLQPLKVSTPKLPGPDASVVAQAMDMLAQAKRPIILAGNGVIRVGATNELRKLAETTGIGVVSTFMAKAPCGIVYPLCGDLSK